MIPFWAWSWILTAVGVTGLWVAGSKKRLGWAIGLFAQVLWITYALSTEQPGFLVSAVAYGTVYARNWRSWRPPSPEERRAALRLALRPVEPRPRTRPKAPR